MGKVSIARIGRVKLKGGADLRILPKPRVDEMEDQLMSDARHLATTGDTPMMGYAIVTWDKTASAGVALKYADYDQGGVYPESIPSFANGALSRCMRAHGLSD